MSKPTIFFSHSSKDKEIVLKIKNKLMKFTSNTIEIFQSSDGESIPFGTNWIHKVEDGLKNSKVMFVFITENSISSEVILYPCKRLRGAFKSPTLIPNPTGIT